MKAYLPYLETLRRLPDDVVLDMATREFSMANDDTCLCGWALRVALSLVNGHTPDEVNVSYNSAEDFAEEFGGSPDEWERIYYGVLKDALPDIELAFIHRVAEAVR